MCLAPCRAATRVSRGASVTLPLNMADRRIGPGAGPPDDDYKLLRDDTESLDESHMRSERSTRSERWMAVFMVCLTLLLFLLLVLRLNQMA